MTATGIEIQNSQNVLNRTFRVVISRTEEDDCYMADIPSLHSCMAFGDTVEEAMANLREVLEGTLETMIAHGWNIPNDNNIMETTLTVPLPQSLSVTA